MLINKDSGTSRITISTSNILLVPYEEHHVPTYHSWMQDEEIQEATASEPLSLQEEHAMQQSWRTDPDKLTFIACLPIPLTLPVATPSSSPNSNNPAKPCSPITAQQHDAPARMLGDINLFLTPADDDPTESCIGELELMIAPADARRRGHGRAAVLAFLMYLQMHLDAILAEYSAGSASLEQGSEEPLGKEEQGRRKMRLSQLRVKIGSRNVTSVKLFQSVGFIRVGEGENYFGEVELVFEGFLGEGRIWEMMERWRAGGYEELKYERSGEE